MFLLWGLRANRAREQMHRHIQTDNGLWRCLLAFKFGVGR
jgi:hypothetical protein